VAEGGGLLNLPALIRTIPDNPNSKNLRGFRQGPARRRPGISSLILSRPVPILVP